MLIWWGIKTVFIGTALIHIYVFHYEYVKKLIIITY